MPTNYVDKMLGAGTSAHFEKDLEHVIPRLLEEKKAPLNLLTLIDVDTDVPSGSEAFEQRFMDEVGKAEFIEDFGGDLPLVDVGGKGKMQRIKFFGTAYQVTLKDMRQAMLATRGPNPRLPSRLGNAAVNTIQRFHNKHGWYGDNAAGITGIFNNADIPTAELGTAIGAGTSDSGEDIAKSILQVAVDVWTRSQQHYGDIRLVMAPELYGYISVTPFNADGGDLTIKEWVMRNGRPFLSELVPAGELSATQKNQRHRMFGFARDPEVIRYVAPTIIEQLPPQWRNLAYRVPVFGETGGVAVDRPAGTIMVKVPRVS